ncbi:MAG: hypothetical protein ACP5NV_04950 [Candidatus Woesearchaeota archaeon]
MRKGQSSSSAAAFIAILAVLIILYILFLPPETREELLSDGKGGSGSGGVGTGSQQNTLTLLKQTVGKVSYISDNEKYYDIPTTRIYAPISGQLIKGVPSFYIRNALFDKEQASYIVSFDIDKKATTNVMLSFNSKEHTGPLTISLNDKEIFTGEVSDSKFIRIGDSDILSTNTLKFSVPNPGVAFWSSNKYSIENLQITADVTDYSSSAATQYFTLTDAEKENLESVTLYFRPVCTLSEVGPLQIQLNGRIIFNAVADCGTRSFASLDINNIDAGSNELKFSVERGSYLLDNLMVKVVLDKPSYKTYFFDIDEKYFTQDADNARCGDYDDICPAGCSDIKDPDCCFAHNGYWCGLPTNNANDRCVYYVDPGDCDSCKTGYYDEGFDPSDTCEGRCGDNTDGVCPSDCPSPSKNYDADCCYEDNEDNFFCQEVPISGLADKCRAQVSYTQCDLCPSGFEDESGSEPDSCDGSIYEYEDLDETLITDYDARIVVRFVNDDDRKRVDINVNGHKLSIDTMDIEFKRNIDEYVRSGSNSVEIIPKEDVDIAEIKIELLKVK